MIKERYLEMLLVGVISRLIAFEEEGLLRWASKRLIRVVIAVNPRQQMEESRARMRVHHHQHTPRIVEGGSINPQQRVELYAKGKARTWAFVSQTRRRVCAVGQLQEYPKPEGSDRPRDADARGKGLWSEGRVGTPA